MNAACLMVRYRSGRSGASDPPGGRLGRHVRSCLRCQAEEARRRSLRRRLAALADEVLIAPAGIPEVVHASIVEPLPGSAVSAQRGRIRAAVTMAAAGAAMAATAGTLAAVGWWRLRVVA